VTSAASSATKREQLKERGGLTFRFLISVLVLAGLTGCEPSYSPDTYASDAAQKANKVDQGIVVGVRKVGVSAVGTVGTVTGAAAGGIAGAQVGVGPVSAFSALGGSLVGGVAGSAVEHAEGDSAAFEYIVRKPNGDLLSVTQRDKTPLALGQKVLVISGNQARVVPDYTVPVATGPKANDPAKADAAGKPGEAKPAEAQPAAAASPAGGSAGAPPAAGTTGLNQPAGNSQATASPTGGAPGTAAPADGKSVSTGPLVPIPAGGQPNGPSPGGAPATGVAPAPTATPFPAPAAGSAGGTAATGTPAPGSGGVTAVVPALSNQPTILAKPADGTARNATP
jgi:outer membrane lipoprotein SlyB